MEEIVVSLVLEALQAALSQAVEKGIEYIIKKIVDDTGKVITQIVYEFDSDGDGKNDSEQVIYTLDFTIPDLNSGYCLVNRGKEIGLGLPDFKLVSADDVLPKLRDSDGFISDGNGFIIDLDNDGANDDIIFPSPIDFTGDGIPDFQKVIDDDDNGLPDVSPDSPFYPVGSDEYQEIIIEHGQEDYTIMNKPLSKYTVTEGILFISLIFGAFGLFKKFFRRKKVV